MATDVHKGTLTVSIQPTIGTFNGFKAEKQTELRINVSAQPKAVSAKVGGKKVKCSLSLYVDFKLEKKKR